MEDRGYEIVDHIADAAVRAWAPDMDGVFAAMAEGLFAVIVDPTSVQPAHQRHISLRAPAPEDLLHDWLDELNGLHQIHREVFVVFEVAVQGSSLTATVRGESIDPSRHRLRTEVKAVTWHGLGLERTANGMRAHVLLDL